MKLLQWLSNNDPLDLIEADLVVAAIVEPRGARALMVGHLLRHFELTAVPQVFRDPRGAEGVTADLCAHAGGLGAPADHAVDVGLAHRPVRELAAAAAA